MKQNSLSGIEACVMHARGSVLRETICAGTGWRARRLTPKPSAVRLLPLVLTALPGGLPGGRQLWAPLKYVHSQERRHGTWKAPDPRQARRRI